LPSVSRSGLEQWFLYVISENEWEFRARVREMLRLKYWIIDALHVAELLWRRSRYEAVAAG
jgi:hypothetical protein